MLKNNHKIDPDALEEKRVTRVIVGLIIPVALMSLDYISFPRMVAHLISLTSYAVAIVNFLLLAKTRSLVFPRNFMALLYVALIFMYLWTFFRIDMSEYRGSMKIIALIHHSNTIYITSLMVLLLPCKKHLDAIIHTFYRLALIVIPLWIVNVNNLVLPWYYGETIGSYLPFFAAFLLGFLDKFTKRQRIIIISIVAFYFLLMSLNARRNVMLSMMLYSFVAYLLYMGKSRRQTFFAVVLGLGCVVVFIMNWDALTQNVLDRVMERGTEDTRSEIEATFLLDFLNAPKTDWAFGRGASGTYYYEKWNDYLMDYDIGRNVIETGYLNIILKSGLVTLALILTFLFYSVVTFFRNRKIGGKPFTFMAWILIIYLLDMYTNNSMSFHGVRPVIFWFMVALAVQTNLQKKQIKDNDRKNKKILRRRQRALYSR